jgi:murein DD-endopeptidase MepM/ murein hydrolase activator NlpD
LDTVKHQNRLRFLACLLSAGLLFVMGFAGSGKVHAADTKEQMLSVQAQMQKTDQQMAEVQQQMTDLDNQLKQNKQQYKTQLKQFKARARAMYMMGNTGYLEILFTSDDLSQMLSRMDSMRAVLKSDQDLIQNIANQKNQIQATKDQMKKTEDQLAQIKKAQEEQYKKLASEYNAENSAANSMNLHFGSGTWTNDYIWPIDLNNPNALNISSGFGGRASPGGIGSINHKGVDVPVSNGTPVMAIADGTVVYAGEASGYGNYVAIDYGTGSDGTTYGSGYGHLSSVQVQVGQHVTKGQVVALSGSTGHSTGPHLHYDFYVNNSQVDARTYYPTLNFTGKGRN